MGRTDSVLYEKICNNINKFNGFDIGTKPIKNNNSKKCLFVIEQSVKSILWIFPSKVEAA
jgi:hypothetical protein